MSADPINPATALLSTTLYCKKQARALQVCQRGTSHTDCEPERQAFITCSEAHIGLVVSHLVKIADRFCPNEVEGAQRCRHVRPGDNCEYEDMLAMRCAARKVLESAAADAQAARARTA